LPRASTRAAKAAKKHGKKAAPRRAAAAKSAKKAASPARAKGTAKRSAQAPAAAKAAAKRASKSTAKAKEASPDKFLADQRGALEAERSSYLAQAEALKAEADQMAQEAEPGDVQFDDESGEGGTVNIDRERDLALSAQARAAVEDIDHALAKIESGTYGTCERCGQPIPRARLKALPQARLCVACKSGGLSRR
jgi:DnaK suppressor protein